ncbi:MAG TPA: UDP-N-acetylmuramoyl-L-alanyl-D-glutamate--2,6-diaminopimelate ligase [Bacteroidales bacterium]|nr:UDP-N-acetylmuramoyl-L-alanyl-D-glutamate--2,6-diaminopimelate ligase [Bacteroidales bacterium]
MMKDLKEILKGIKVSTANGDTSVIITGITSDSRTVERGNVFVAVKGTKSDGHDFIEKAVGTGAVAVICETMPADRAKGVTYIVAEDSATALGMAASAFYDHPSEKLRLTGVTGTNGKTTIATLLYNMFEAMGYRCGLLSTVCNYVHQRVEPATHTTPDPVKLNALMADMVAEGCEYVFMEVSSHAIDQKRIAGLSFAGGIFTNLTHDHLDYHLTFANYLTAKKKFFDDLPATAFALVNNDDRNGSVMLQNCKAAKHTFSMHGMASFRGSITEQGFEGMLLKINGTEVWTRFLGDYNASNLLAVFGGSVLLGAKKDEALTVLSTMVPVAGRMEVIRSSDGITGIVDYAHTPDAVENVIGAVNRLRQGSGKLIVVVGAGGDRDRTKRPVMASIAAAGADRLILTSDNPRSEDPEMILDEMLAGLTPDTMAKTLRITRRGDAIRAAVMLASPGDIIIVAGKGHETYQEVKGVRHHFDDREELRKAFKMS